jgi:hypothetical protein
MKLWRIQAVAIALFTMLASPAYAAEACANVLVDGAQGRFAEPLVYEPVAAATATDAGIDDVCRPQCAVQSAACRYVDADAGGVRTDANGWRAARVTCHCTARADAGRVDTRDAPDLQAPSWSIAPTRRTGARAAMLLVAVAGCVAAPRSRRRR